MDFLTRLAAGALFVIIIATVTSSLDSTHSNNTPRVIELVGYNNRKARTHYKPEAEVATSSAKIQADIKTVKQNIEKYNKILSVDTKNLPKFQKDMLDRIVDRVARLKESLDINEKLTQVLNQTQFNKQHEIEEINVLENAENVENVTQLQLFTKNNTSTEKIDWLDKTDSSLLMDEQALLKLQTSLDKLSSEDVTTFQTKSHPRHLPITTEIIDFADTQQNDQKFTDITSDQAELFLYESTTSVPLELIDTTANDELFMVARSNNNNNNIAITAASPPFGNHPRPSSASSKITKMKATKRPPHSSTRFAQIPSIKRKPATVLSESTSNKSYSNYTTKTITKTISSATQQQHQQPLEHYQKSTQQQQTQYPLPNLYTQLPEDADPILLPTSTINMDKYNAASVLSTPSIPLAPSSALLSSPAVNNVPATSSSLAAAVSTAPIIDFSKGTNFQNSQNLMYDGHFNTSAIIDSLNNAREEEFYHQKEASPTIASNNNDENPTTGGKPTKYHYYPHNQHIYLLPECAIQQVCNAVYVRLNYTQPLCACPSRYRDPCSASLNEDDHHTTKLVGDSKKKAITLAKTCEATTEMRECRSPKDWSLLALQNTRTGKSHYLVICRCPEHFKMDGPLAHDQNTYASVPGIRVYGMMCVKPGYPVRKASAQPPKRYQLQKPAYRPGSQYGRPSISGLLNSPPHQSQSHSQSTYQYLNRPESTINTSFQNNYHRPDTISINNYPGATYGRHSEREDNSFIEALLEKNDDKVNISSSTQRVLMEEEERSAKLNDRKVQAHTHTREPNNREKRSLMEHIITWPRHLDVAQILGFPWQRVQEFERSLN